MVSVSGLPHQGHSVSWNSIGFISRASVLASDYALDTSPDARAGLAAPRLPFGDEIPDSRLHAHFPARDRQESPAESMRRSVLIAPIQTGSKEYLATGVQASNRAARALAAGVDQKFEECQRRALANAQGAPH